MILIKIIKTESFGNEKVNNPEKKLFGCVDLLIRADWIEKLFNMIYPYYYTSCNKTNNCHYVIVDIKFHRLQLNVDNSTVRNEGMINVFKSQLCIYNTILGYMQGYLPKSAYILGRGWKQQRIKKGELIIEKNSDPFDKLGVINFLEKDSNIVVKTEEGCNWLHELNTNIDNFNEIIPKMKNLINSIVFVKELLFASLVNKVLRIKFTYILYKISYL